MSSSGLTGRSSAPRPLGSIAGVSGIPVHPHARVMTTESVAAFVFIGHGSAFPRRDAPGLCQNFRPKEGVGNAGRPVHPQPRVRSGSANCTRVFTAVAPEITRHPRTQWFTAYIVLSPAIGLFWHRRLADIGMSARLGSRTSARLDADL